MIKEKIITDRKFSEYSPEHWLRCIASIQNTNDLRELSSVFVEPMGFKYAIAYRVSKFDGTEKQNSSRYFYKGVPKDAINYIKSKYTNKVDPVTCHVMRIGHAVWLSDLLEEKSLSAHHKVMQATVSHVGDGICVPCFYKSHWGYSFAGFGRAKAEFSDIMVWQVETISRLIHTRYVHLTEILKEKVKFTNRELNVAELIAMGKTNSEIAEILGITTHTVAGYVKQIYLKLDTTDRVTTTLKALSLNLIG